MFTLLFLLIDLLSRNWEKLRQKSMPFTLALLIVEPFAFVHFKPNDLVPVVGPFLNPIIVGAIIAGSSFLFYWYYKDIIKRRYKYPRLSIIAGMAVVAALAFVQVEGTIAITFFTSVFDYGLVNAATDFLKVLGGEISWQAFDAQYHDLLALKIGWILISTWMNYVIFSTVTKDPVEEFYYKRLRKHLPRLPK